MGGIDIDMMPGRGKAGCGEVGSIGRGHFDARFWLRTTLVGAFASLVILFAPAPAEAVELGWYDCATAGSAVECVGGDGIRGPGTSNPRAMWDFYCRHHSDGGSSQDAFGDYPPTVPGLTPEQLEAPNGWAYVDRSEVLTPFWIEAYDLNPTGEYQRWYVYCWDIGDPDRGIEPRYRIGRPYYTAAEAIWRPGSADPAFWITPIAPPLDPFAWRDQLMSLVPTGPPPLATAPDAGLMAVNVPTWIWLAGGYAPPAGITVTDTSGSAELSITATPAEMMFVSGTGDVITCPVDAAPWVPGADPTTGCTYTYEVPSPVASAFSARVAVRWDFTWTFANPGVRIFVQDELFFQSTPFTAFDTTVDELQILETE
jgi:hypothetical protein